MDSSQYHIGMLVRHPAKQEWGIGKILTLTDGLAKVHFKDDAQEFRALRLDLVSLYAAEVQTDPVLDNLPPFLGDRFDVSDKRVTLAAALKKFSELFPGGFDDQGYWASERQYKLDAHQKFLKEFGDGQFELLLRQKSVTELIRRILSVTAVNLLSPYESMAFRDGLRGDEQVAGVYFESLFAVLHEGLRDESFGRLCRAVSDLPAGRDQARVATWPVVTLPLYLAEPRGFMFLKPEPTRACADRLRFDIQYRPDPNWITYSKLIDLSNRLLGQLEAFAAKDYIDVQSFMWVIAKY